MAKPDYFVDVGPTLTGSNDAPNNVASTVAVGINDTITSIEVAPGDGALFAPQTANHNVWATLDNGVNIEVVRVTARAGDVLTVVRNWEGAAATGYAFGVGALIERRLTKGMLQALSPLNPNTGTVEIGRNATTPGAISIAIGEDVSSGPSSDAIAIGRGIAPVGATQGAVLIGRSVEVPSGSSSSSVAIGPDVLIDTTSAVVIGTGAKNRDYSSVAIGDSAQVLYAEEAVAIGYNRKAIHHAEFVAPPRVCRRTDGYEYYPGVHAPWALGGVYTQTFPPMDIGVPLVWATSESYLDMTVVKALTTPVGTIQYFLDVQASDPDPDTNGYSIYDGHFNGLNNTVDSTTEPDFTTGAADGSWHDEPNRTDAVWIGLDPVNGCELDISNLGSSNSGERYRFMPTKVAFYCYASTGTITTNPEFSLGNEDSDTAYLTNQVILADGKNGLEHWMQWFEIGKTAAVSCGANLKVTLTTPGVGGSIQGKFIVEGYYVANRA